MLMDRRRLPDATSGRDGADTRYRVIVGDWKLDGEHGDDC